MCIVSHRVIRCHRQDRRSVCVTFHIFCFSVSARTSHTACVSLHTPSPVSARAPCTICVSFHISQTDRKRFVIHLACIVAHTNVAQFSAPYVHRYTIHRSRRSESRPFYMCIGTHFLSLHDLTSARMICVSFHTHRPSESTRSVTPYVYRLTPRHRAVFVNANAFCVSFHIFLYHASVQLPRKVCIVIHPSLLPYPLPQYRRHPR